MQVTGYVDRFSARPGDEVSCYVSVAQAGNVGIDVVRLIHGDENKAGPGFKVEPVGQIASRMIAAEHQSTHLGSCMVAHDVWRNAPSALTLELLVWPTLPQRGRRQGLVSIVGATRETVAISLADDGTLELVGGVCGQLSVICRADAPLPSREWRRVRASVDSETGLVTLQWEPVNERRGLDGSREVAAEASVVIPESATCVVAALACDYSEDRPIPEGCFNGKIERPKIGTLDGSGRPVLADWRFELGIDGAGVIDTSGRDKHGTLINIPARAVTGHSWTGNQLSHLQVADQYAAVHFHEDDLEDAHWAESTRITLPEDLRSGVYAIRLTGSEDVDHVPFCVLPRVNRARSAVTLLLPTFSYLAYANEHLLEREAHSLPIGRHDAAVLAHPEFSRSLYDCHVDGSGFCYASSRRPLLNIRPEYRSWVHDAPRHLAADLYIVDWLEHLGIVYDVITDHDLHRDGGAALGDTSVVITGGHPEYVSARMLDALDAHLSRGGKMMYLGGNGFYWVTSQDRHRSHIIEVRRGHAGTRTWESEPGETSHSTTGEPGGLWRYRGRPPNALVGVGFSGQLSGVRSDAVRAVLKAPGYKRQPDSFRPEAAFAFEGIADDEIIGDFGLIMDGACGDEIDRYDAGLGSSRDALLLLGRPNTPSSISSVAKMLR